MPSGLTLDRPRDPAAFEAIARSFLLAHEAENCLMLGLTSQLQLGSSSLTATAPYFGVVRTRDAVTGAALMAGFVVVLSYPITEPAIWLLVDDVAEAAPDAPGVVGPVESSGRFADAWTGRTGRAHRLNMSERIFRIDRVIPPRPTSGSMRIADKLDHAVLAEWIGAFAHEALGEPPDPTWKDGAATRWIEREGRTMYIWLDGGRAVSMVGVSGDTPSGIRVAPVYTPPELRGRGYASALTAAVTQAQLDAGKRYCFLYTDLANPTSNHIYAELGYEPRADFRLFDLIWV